MKQFSLFSLLLLIAFIGASLGWWLERTKRSEVYYLHIFGERISNIHDRNHPDVIQKMKGFDGPVELSRRPGPPRPVRLATLSFTPNAYFEHDVPNGFSPALHIKGKLSPKDRTQMDGELIIRIERA